MKARIDKVDKIVLKGQTVLTDWKPWLKEINSYGLYIVDTFIEKLLQIGVMVFIIKGLRLFAVLAVCSLGGICSIKPASCAVVYCTSEHTDSQLLAMLQITRNLQT